MKWCVCFPEEDILIKRPCLRRACMNNNTGAAFLSYLLYQVSISKEYRQRLEKSNQQENATHTLSVDIDKTQLEIVSEMDNEMSDRTLRDTAIPLLVALGYIDVDASDKANTYTIHLAQIQRGINNPPKTSEFLLTLQHLIDDGNTSEKWRKYFLRLLAMLPTHRGKSTDHKKRPRTACEEERRSSSSKDKIEKSNNDLRKIQVVATQTEEMQKNVTANIAATAPPSSDIFVSEISTERQRQPEASIKRPQSPDSTASRTAQTVLQLIEFLRGHTFCEPERSQQVRAAAILIGIQPALRLKDIQDAWFHGSDEYWKRNYDQSGMTVTDLAHHNSHGKRRVIAVLEHKQRQERKPTHQESNQDVRGYAEHPSSTSAIEPAWSGQIMTEQEAQQLAIQATDDGQDHHYSLKVYSTYEQNIWVVKVHIEQHVLTIHSPSEWLQEFAGIHEVLQLRKKLSTGKRDLLCIK
jgi:hypothetical protein